MTRLWTGKTHVLRAEPLLLGRVGGDQWMLLGQQSKADVKFLLFLL